MATPDQISKIALRLRNHVLKMTTAAGSGHPTSCLSCAEIMAALFFHEMKYDIHDPNNWGNDEFVLSKGHAAPILWAVYAEAGIIPKNELLNLRKITSNLEGHPTPRMPWVKVATGSLGQGFPAAVGMAWAMRQGKSPGRVYCLLGDSECAEGSVWEAANIAAHEKLTNLVVIVDMNRLGQTGPTMHEHETTTYIKKFEAFGFDCVSINGHNIGHIITALEKARTSTKPIAIIAKTLKGKGVSYMQDINGWHGKAASSEELEKALKELGPVPDVDAKKLVNTRPKIPQPSMKWIGKFKTSNYAKPAATRDGFGKALVTLGRMNNGIIAVDADVRNSTREEWFFKEFPERSVNCFIAEQAMVGFAMGLAAKGFIPFPSSFSCFLTRAADFIRMAELSDLNLKFVGSHSGVSIGEDGPSQMGLEDLALFRSIPGSVVLYPSDAVSAEYCTQLLAQHKGMGYLRTARMETPNIYSEKDKFGIGGSTILKKSKKDSATIVAAGVTVHEALTAHTELAKQGISVRIIDTYSVQPLDVKTLTQSAIETKGNVLVVEDHYAAGGLGEAVAMALSGKAHVTHLCIRERPRSGKPRELLEMYGISADHIVKTVKTRIRK